jgi:Tol biopolymer transport system component/DNA-binding winged helix-turn-helix (wHTH) protein
MQDDTETLRTGYRFDDVVVDRENYRVTKAGEARTLAPRAFDVLVYLVENRGRVVDKRELHDRVWGEVFVTDNALTKAVKEVRQALGDDAASPRYVETVPKRGYRFVADVESLERPRETVEPVPVPPPPANPTYLAVALGAVALLVFGALAGVWLLRGERVESGLASAARRTTQLTTWSGLDLHPAFSPDGNAVAFASDRDGAFDLYVRQLAPGGREVRVTTDGGNMQPSWSPDGKTIAYYSQRRGGIWTVPSLGGVARRVAPFGSRPRWSPDGTTILFQSDGVTDLGPTAFGAMPPSTLWLVPASGGDPRPLTTRDAPPGGHGSPAWSPDGRRVVFVTYGIGSGGLWTVSLDDGRIAPVARFRLFAFDPVWSPDGEHVYFAAASDTKDHAVWRVRVDDPEGRPEMVANTGASLARALAISPDGRRIVYSATTMTNNVWAVPLSPETGESAGEAAPLTSDTSFRKTWPSFSRDGSRIAYAVAMTGSPPDVWVMSADGTGASPVTSHEGSDSFPSWLPDNRRIAFLARRREPDSLMTVDVVSGEERTVYDGPLEIAFPRVSPDGSRVAFHTSAGGGAINVWTLPLDGGEPSQVTRDAELAGWPCWSPDGAWIAFELKRGSETHIAVVPSGGGEVEQLTAEPGQAWTGSWAPDGDRIVFAALRDGVWNLWSVSRSTRRQVQITANTKPNVYLRAPDWSPRGDRVIFEHAEVTGNVWLMELSDRAGRPPDR